MELGPLRGRVEAKRQGYPAGHLGTVRCGAPAFACQDGLGDLASQVSGCLELYRQANSAAAFGPCISMRKVVIKTPAAVMVQDTTQALDAPVRPASVYLVIGSSNGLGRDRLQR